MDDVTASQLPSPQRNHDSGASLVEYALLVSLVVLVCIGAIRFFGTELRDSLDDSGSSVASATSP